MQIQKIGDGELVRRRPGSTTSGQGVTEAEKKEKEEEKSRAKSRHHWKRITAAEAVLVLGDRKGQQE